MVYAVLLLLLMAGHQASSWGLDWFKDKDTMDRVKDKGYPCEKHYVTTADEYILKMYRIPYGNDSSTSEGKPRPSVIVQHGVLCSSDCWVDGETSRALAFVLADNGYDVWLPNNRGNTYSRNHTTLSDKDAKFWDFSIHEMGIYDLPAEIDYVLKNTGEIKTSYVGHSQGTSIFFIMASSLPEYAAKLNVATALAPVVYLNETKGLVTALSHMATFLEKTAKFLRLKYVLDHNFYYKILDNTICRIPLVNSLCADLMFVIGGFDSTALDYKLLAEVADYCPTGVSIKDLRHFGQWTRNGGKFTEFDYESDNMKLYNASEPPEYLLSNIACPVALFYSRNDFIATYPEVQRLAQQIPTLVESYEVPFEDFNHLDFMWAKNVMEVLYGELLKVLKKYNRATIERDIKSFQ